MRRIIYNQKQIIYHKLFQTKGRLREGAGARQVAGSLARQTVKDVKGIREVK